ncbi:EPS15 homology (EH) [Macleaya cordata]|uniref:EPS15 homology (EH) n=1 Tax=Macleaya cordata TaxID=56857 RepID=A0A200PQY4_MACCD|nr:EPS15 homology (EH) [Macleaya cordata]
MAGQNPAPNVDLFDAYFRRADLDQDGRISGNEAVAFFQGANLPKHVLAQIWMHADQNRTGFLGRAEFYNALKLVTVAQSKRELTPDIVKAALFGPAAAKIPAPQINLAATAAPQLSSAAPTPQMGAAAAAASQNLSFRGPQVLPNAGVSQQQFPSQANQFMRPPLPAGAGSLPTQGVPGQGFPVRGTMTAPRPPNSSVSTDWLGGRTGGAPLDASSQVPSRGVTPSMSQDGFGMGPSGLTSSIPPRPQANSGPTQSVAPRPHNQVLPSFQPAPKDSKALVVSGNGFASDSIFGGDVFSAISSQPKQDASSSTFSASSVPVSSAIVPVSSGPQSSVKQSPLDSLQSTFSMQPSGAPLQRTQSLAKQNQQTPTQSTSTFMSSGVSAGAGNSASSQSQPPWPRMSQSDIQKYTKVFVEVDTDRDGRITGEQARNLFLSWRLPREVLKQVWDLSDQDNDSMLSLREFCTALYLMERYREGRPLPAVLPSSIMFDETLLPTAGQPTAAYGNAAWGPTPGLQQQQGMPGSRQMMPTAGVRPQVQVPPHPQGDRGVPPNQQKSRVPVLEKHLVNQLSKEEQNSLNSKFEEATEADKKVEELEKEILDSREKIEFYRTKMQELVLYKSRCDNRLNEITERASADKREVESLTKKYEEKYKQVGDIASKLTIEEATFRDIQERKMELYNAIVKIEQGGSTDGILQVRADRIQSDLEELVKALNERCKKYGLRVKPTALVELPFGWQPGIQEGAADWDEDWDKFEDEGFTFVKELTLDVQNIIAPPKEKSKSVWKEKTSADEGLTADSPSNADSKSEKPSSTAEHAHDGGSPYAHSEDDSARSPPGSPTGRSTLESPSQEFRETHFGKNFDTDASPRSKERHSDHGGAESMISGDKSFDEHTWGTFDNNDDTDSVWGFNPTKDSDHDRNKDSFFGSSDLGLNPIRTESPQASSLFGGKKSPFNFGDSVPGTPLFNSSNSPPRYSEGSEEHHFDNFSRFDSFSMHDSGFFPPPESSLARFDSIRSTRDSDHSRGFSSFDDADPFGSSGPFKTSTESQTPRRGSDNWSAF